MKSKTSLLIILLLCATQIYAVETRLKLLSGGDKKLRTKIETVVTKVLNTVNAYHKNRADLNSIRNMFTQTAYQDFSRILDHTKFSANQKEYTTYLLGTQNGEYEVRNIRVKIVSKDKMVIPYQNLVFVFDKQAQIVNVRFSVEDHHYQEIIKKGQELQDLAFREKILHFIELYRTAYNKEDIDFIEKTLSEDALIIVGHVIQTRKTDSDYLEKSYLDNEQIEFIRLGKYEYLERLKAAFEKNEFIQVQFDEINIQNHPSIEKIYGVQLKQRWNSSFYSDVGYLFLMVDFITENDPIIHVRAWQPDKFADGSTINIYDFEVIE